MPDTTEFSMTVVIYHDEHHDPNSADYKQWILPSIPRIGETLDVRDDFTIPPINALCTVVDVKYVLKNTGDGMSYACRVYCVKKGS